MRTKTGKETNPEGGDEIKIKKPLTAYFLFLGDHRASYKEKNPEAKMGDISKALGK